MSPQAVSYTHLDVYKRQMALYAVDLQNTMVFCAALTGACLGFLKFNCYPANVFMGDTGSLALGAAVALMGIVSRMQFLILVTCLLYTSRCV